MFSETKTLFSLGPTALNFTEAAGAEWCEDIVWTEVGAGCQTHLLGLAVRLTTVVFGDSASSALFSASQSRSLSSVIQILPVISPMLKTTLSRATERFCETRLALPSESRAPCA